MCHPGIWIKRKFDDDDRIIPVSIIVSEPHLCLNVWIDTQGKGFRMYQLVRSITTCRSGSNDDNVYNIWLECVNT